MYSGFEIETKPINLQPFQWPVPENMEVVTRSGEKVTQLTKFECEDGCPLRGVINEGYISAWTITGKGTGYNTDLFLRPIPRERWVVVNDKMGTVRDRLFLSEFDATNSILKEYRSEFSFHKITLP